MWSSALILVFFALYPGIDVTAKYLRTSTDIDTDQIIYERYVELDQNIKKLVSYGVKMVLPYIMEANEHLNLSSNCTTDIFQLISGLKKLKVSALRFLDATGKLPPGLMTGTLHMLGDYDECMTTSVLRKDGIAAFKGQYCMLYVKAILPKKKRIMTLNSGLEELVEYTKNTSEIIQFLVSMVQSFYDNPAKFGLCVPSGCSSKDISSILSYLGEKSYINATVDYCDQQAESQIRPGTIIAIISFSLVGLLLLIGSSVDYYARKKTVTFQSNSARYLLCFSILTNFPKVISTKISDKSLTSVFGIRSLSLFYIILMHQYYFIGKMEIQGHKLRYKEEFPQFFMQVGLNGFLTTEVFFFLGGLVNAYSRMKVHESCKHKLSFIQIVVHRLWRIYPTYLFSILTAFLLTKCRGPMGTHVKRDYSENCHKYWWQNILFINNFFVQEDTCMPHSWYIAADMHLFLLSLFTVPVLLRNAKHGIILHIVILVAGITSTSLWAWHKELMPAIIVHRLDRDDIGRVWNAYATTIPHIAPYFTGLIAGYILSKWKDLRIPTISQVFGWPIAAACLISMLFMTREWNSGVDFTLVESCLYFAFCRFLYVLAVAWLVVCCARGYGGILNYILSLKVWVLITRISYMVYLISPLLQLHYFGNLKMGIDNDRITLIWRYMGDLGLSCLMGLALVVVIESPFISMEKLLFQRRSSMEKENCEKNVDAHDKNMNGRKPHTEIEQEENIKNTFVNIELKE